MSAPTVPITKASHRVLNELADQTGLTMMDILDKALRRVLGGKYNRGRRGYAASRC